MDVVEKRLGSRARSDKEAVAWFRSEARLLELLGGRVTPALLAAGDDERGPFLRMAKIADPTLAERLATRAGPLDERWIERAFRASVAALATLHDGDPSVVHADLSPANLAIDDDGTVVTILDLGLACWAEAPPRDGAFRGTIAYAAPEVARGELPTARSDLFSLAATFLHAATGEPPRRGASFAAVLTAAAERPIVEERHRALAKRGPAHVALLACLAHAPDDRPASARCLGL